MKQIKYSYCVDEEDNLVHIQSITPETRHKCKLLCLQCGREMVANLGTKKTWYFSHKAETACDGESYLHKLAKRRILEKFDSTDNFPITFVRDVPCNRNKTCLFFHDSECQVKGMRIPFDLRKWYDTCKEEEKEGEFRPDLLLTCSKKPNRDPIFIEVYKTHRSENAKVESGYKIIETTQLKSEDDVEDIINRGFVEGENCQTFNFNPKLPDVRKNDVPIERFVLFGNGKAYIHKAYEYEIYCDQIDKKFNPNSVCELNIKDSGIELWGEYERNKILDSYTAGLVYLIKKGWKIRNCILCKFRKYNECSGYICIRYKSLGAQYKDAKQVNANSCPYYEIDQEKQNHPLSELEKIISEVPT